MKRTLAALVVFFASLPTLHAQTMPREEEFVRDTYAKLSLMCAVGVLTENVIFTEGGDKMSQLEIDHKMAEALPVYELSNFQIGVFSSIKDRPLGDFVSLPADGQHVLRISGRAIAYSDPPHRASDPAFHWGELSVHWTDPDTRNFPNLQTLMSQFQTGSLQEFTGPGLPPKPIQLVTYTRYAAFTVNATFQGESTGSYKAVFIFGTYGQGKENIFAYDLISGEHDNVGLENMLAEPGYPEGFLRSKLRDHPVIANWIRANEMPSSSCSLVKGDVCCSHGRCGISQTDLNRDLAAPVP